MDTNLFGGSRKRAHPSGQTVHAYKLQCVPGGWGSRLRSPGSKIKYFLTTEENIGGSLNLGHGSKRFQNLDPILPFSHANIETFFDSC